MCERRKIIDARLDDIEYCNCTKETLQKAKSDNAKNPTSTDKYTEWKPYIERKNMVVWRREEKPGMFAYKGKCFNVVSWVDFFKLFICFWLIVHASYTDITAEDFLHVQTNTTYRKQWDKSAIALDVVDVDPKNAHKSHVIYWEMLWPVSILNFY